MRRIKKKSERRVRVSISISPELNDFIENISDNKSKYIENSIFEYLTKYTDIDTSKIII